MQGNTLYPIFVKLDVVNTLVVGGGNVGLEKTTALLNNNPNANILIISTGIIDELAQIVEEYHNVEYIEKPFETTDLHGKHLVIAATNNFETNILIKNTAEKYKVLTNVADTPNLCDFYLGSTVKKGDLKIGISTNGKSPTFAKRFKEILNEELTDDLETLLENLNTLRFHLKGDFQSKVKELNEVTSSLIKEKEALN